MLAYNEIKPGRIILHEGAPFEVISSAISRKQQRKPQNVVKMRNLVTGKVLENSFHSNESVDEADISLREIKYLYKDNKGQAWFCNPENPKDRFSISLESVGDQLKFVKENETIEAREFDGETIGLRLPIKVELKVTEAPPDVRGNTAQGGSKQVTLETGAVVTVPMFIKEGDTLKINTDTGEYTERV